MIDSGSVTSGKYVIGFDVAGRGEFSTAAIVIWEKRDGVMFQVSEGMARTLTVALRLAKSRLSWLQRWRLRKVKLETLIEKEWQRPGE